jgi:hypothetical protein
MNTLATGNKRQDQSVSIPKLLLETLNWLLVLALSFGWVVLLAELMK